MLNSVNWGEKVGQLFGGHLGRVLKVAAIFACAVILLLGLYRVRTSRINNEEITKNQLLKSVGYEVGVQVGERWLILANPDDDDSVFNMSRLEEVTSTSGDYHTYVASGSDYVCVAIEVAAASGWKTIVIGPHLRCCSKPNCHAMDDDQFLHLPYRSASVIRHLLSHSHGVEKEPYKATIRNLAFLWAIQKGARFIFDAYVEEYQSAGIRLAHFEEEFSRQLQSLVLDESLSLVEERSKSRLSSLKTNPYTHFGRKDVRLLPGGASQTKKPKTHSHSSNHDKDFPSFRICEVRPPSIEKFLEIDEGWWDTRAPPLVLPGDTMPPLCTRNTLFSPEVFWALPILPDYSTLDEGGMTAKSNLSRIPPWYIRGLWSQSLLGDLGGSIRLSLSRIPTLQISSPPVGRDDTSMSYTEANLNRTRGSRLLKRWSCRSKSTFRCLLLMAKELRKSVYFGRDDISLIEAFVVDLKSLRYSEPRMLPKRRSYGAPCLGADGLHGVSFHPALEPKESFTTAEFLIERERTLNNLIRTLSQATQGQDPEREGGREKRETERPVMLSQSLVPPSQTGHSSDWSLHSSDYSMHGDYINSYRSIPGTEQDDSYLLGIASDSSYEIRGEDRVVPFSNLGKFNRPQLGAPRSGKQFRAFLQQVVAKSVQDGNAGDGFPILKAMADNICPGFGPLLPFQPQKTESDILLIVAFTNHHYDLIPTLEVIYRTTYPNILYCGHPHESIEIFLRKYQTAEHRSFSFLPTYTRATYECLLGAIEMNYDVKGYLLVTDETLLVPTQLHRLDKEKLWISSTGVDKVTRSNWHKIDPGGQKLPKLIEGITSAWTLFSYILKGQDSAPFLQPGTKHISRQKRSEEETVGSGENLEKAASAHITSPHFQKRQEPSASSEQSSVKPNNNGELDLVVSDWDYLNTSKLTGQGDEWSRNTSQVANEETDEVLVGEDEDDISNMTEILSSLQLMETDGELSLTSSMSPTPSNRDDVAEAVEPQLDESVPRNFSEDSMGFRESVQASTTQTPTFIESSTPADESDSSLGVPLYHVEHADPPKAPKWQPQASTEGTEYVSDGTSTGSTGFSSSVAPPAMSDGDKKEGAFPTSHHHHHPPHEDVKKEMERLLEGLHQVYALLLELESDYEESNKGSLSYPPKHIHSSDVSSEIPETLTLPDGKSHRISPREFRHIRCTKVDDGHQSELCGTLRSHVRTLGENLGSELRLFHASTPLYYIPTQQTRSFYSIANVLLHYGVMDELALPLIIRGLSKEKDWIKFNATTSLVLSTEDDTPRFLFPFDLHKVYGDSQIQNTFCHKFLLPIFSQ